MIQIELRNSATNQNVTRKPFWEFSMGASAVQVTAYIGYKTIDFNEVLRPFCNIEGEVGQKWQMDRYISHIGCAGVPKLKYADYISWDHRCQPAAPISNYEFTTMCVCWCGPPAACRSIAFQSVCYCQCRLISSSSRHQDGDIAIASPPFPVPSVCLSAGNSSSSHQIKSIFR